MLQTSGPLSGLLQYMNYLQKGLAVHADNLSRVDMPNAQAKELKPFAEQIDKAVTSAKIVKTDSGHLSVMASNTSGVSVHGSRSQKVSYSGNNISREGEVSKINDLTTNYLKAVRLYEKGLSMFRTILGSKG